MHLDRVEPGVLQQPRHVHKVAGDSGDVVVGHRLREPERHWAEDPRRRESGVTGSRCDRSGMADLRRDGRTLGMHRFGQLPQPIDRFWPHHDLSGRALPIR